jgi:hypothetical protein
MRNSFGLNVHEIKEIVVDKKVKQTIGSMLSFVLPALEFLLTNPKKYSKVFVVCAEKLKNKKPTNPSQKVKFFLPFQSGGDSSAP